jgi:hypothetical protein
MDTELEISRQELPQMVNASDRGRNAKEKIMASLLDAVWDEIPIEIDEIITEEELFQWKIEWWQDHDPEQYPGGAYALNNDLYNVAVVLPTGTIVRGHGGIERPM